MKYLILGAGPAGLSFANRLQQLGETSFLVVEKEREAGGLCRSVEVDQAPFDIIMKRLLQWAQDKSVYGLGRWGEWSHYNSDVTVDLAMKLAEKIR